MAKLHQRVIVEACFPLRSEPLLHHVLVMRQQPRWVPGARGGEVGGVEEQEEGPEEQEAGPEEQDRERRGRAEPDTDVSGEQSGGGGPQ